MFGIFSGLLAMALIGNAAPADADRQAAERQRMVAEVRNLAATAGMKSTRQLDERVLRSLATAPRHLFVPPALQPYAYANRPLPIGNEQTISQPFIVALMTDLLAPSKDDVVLEVGTGSGY